MNNTLNERIHSLFNVCAGHNVSGTADLKSVLQVFWPLLDNSFTMIDVSNVFNMAVSGEPNGNKLLDKGVFLEFVQGMARLKFPASNNYVLDFLDLLSNDAKNIKIKDTTLISRSFDRHVCRVLLKYDLPLRRAFSTFAGKGSDIGVNITWDEITTLGIGMELDGFVALCASSTISPHPISLELCKTMSKEILNSFPTVASVASQHSVLLYPHFQILLCRVAIEVESLIFTDTSAAAATKTKDTNNNGDVRRFARKVTVVDEKPVSNLLNFLFKKMGIEKLGPNSKFSFQEGGNLDYDGFGEDEGEIGVIGQNLEDFNFADSDNNNNQGQMNAPHFKHPEDQYMQYLNNGRQTMLLRLEHLLDDVETRLMKLMDSGDDVIQNLAIIRQNAIESQVVNNKYASKPVVIGDALPIPTSIDPKVEQLLEAALAHHNLGSYEESLKFLEAAKLQLEEIAIEAAKEEYRAKKALEENSKASADAETEDQTKTAAEAGVEESTGNLQSAESIIDVKDLDIKIPLDVEMYIMLCKGNVYQSAGDDENSILHYLNAWSHAESKENMEWQIVCINSIGMLAYYSLRYEVSFLCFHKVVAYRSNEYGNDSADTATAENNEGCALFALNDRSASRIRFEHSWSVMCKILGHRHPRCVAIWKNLERSRRAQTTLRRRDMIESIALRDDSDMILAATEGNYTIKAFPPPVATGKKKGKKGGGKKKKK